MTVMDTGQLAAAREQMVTNQIARRGIRDRAVLRAMLAVPREAFLPPELAEFAYEDHPLPIAEGQTISQPYIVALMTAAAELRPTDRVLEIGTGSGYAAAVLSRLAHWVHTIERIDALATLARQRLAALGYDNVTVHTGDGTLGLPSEAPFDGIVVTAGGLRLPPPLAEQLAIGGRLVIPLQNGGGQSMRRFTRHEQGLEEENLGAFAFVPLIGTFGWADE